jgi:hypothetical protein
MPELLAAGGDLGRELTAIGQELGEDPRAPVTSALDAGRAKAP